MSEAANGLEMSTIGLSVRSRDGRMILRGVNLDIPERMVTGIIGPSGVGKTTLLKCLNRLVDMTTLSVAGRITFRGEDLRGGAIDPDELRRRVGIVFQQPVTFPGSISTNVLFAARRLRLVKKQHESELVERCLRAAGLWEETKDRLPESAAALSVGQQQRLAIARTLAGEPDVILMDEPTSALDPKATAALEETILSLKETKTIVLVTHHLEQARRLAGWIACLCPVDGAGELIEANQCELIFNSPTRRETIDFLSCCR